MIFRDFLDLLLLYFLDVFLLLFLRLPPNKEIQFFSSSAFFNNLTFFGSDRAEYVPDISSRNICFNSLHEYEL